MMPIINEALMIGYLGLPEKAGNIPVDGDRFDHEFFKISEKEANIIDNQTRMLSEKVYEAICDAGKQVLLCFCA